MTSDYRALCVELAEALCGYDLTKQDQRLVHRARAALAVEPQDVPVWTKAEIRALVEAKLPKEATPKLCSDGSCEDGEISRWHERQRLRLDLLAEVDRAEAGK